MDIRGKVIDGLQALYVLNLPSTPPADKMQAVGEVWISVVEAHCKWDERVDAGRIEKAFALLLAESERWPYPKMLLDRLPRRPELPKPPAPTITPEDRAEASKVLDDLLKKMRMKL